MQFVRNNIVYLLQLINQVLKELRSRLVFLNGFGFYDVSLIYKANILLENLKY